MTTSNGTRPDVLQVALDAISDYERIARRQDVVTKVAFERAVLRTLYAIAEEVRIGRLHGQNTAVRLGGIADALDLMVVAVDGLDDVDGMDGEGDA